VNNRVGDDLTKDEALLMRVPRLFVKFLVEDDDDIINGRQVLRVAYSLVVWNIGRRWRGRELKQFNVDSVGGCELGSGKIDVHGLIVVSGGARESHEHHMEPERQQKYIRLTPPSPLRTIFAPKSRS
jgi:hypothetical protein